MAEASWAADVSGAFTDASDWSGGEAPNALDDANLAEDGGDAYTVSSAATATVGSLQTAANAELAITGGNFTDTDGSGVGVDAGVIAVSPGAILTVGGTVDVSGAVQLEQTGTSQGSELVVTSGGLTLEGGGQLDLEDPFVNTGGAGRTPPTDSLDKIYVAAGGGTLVNVDDTIMGAGVIGEGNLALVNDARGVIDASLSTDLTINDADGGITNDGLMESTGGGGLFIVSSTVDQTFGGKLLAAGGVVYLSDADIEGGTLETTGTSEIELDQGDTVLDGELTGGLANKGKLVVSGRATATLEGAMDNSGQIDLGQGASASGLMVGAIGATLTGDGSILLGGSDPETGITGEGTLTNVDNTIAGQGVIGDASMDLVNEGLVDADQALALTVTGAVDNGRLIEATGKGGLQLSSTTIANASGTIMAASGSQVVLTDAVIQGGTLTTSGNGLLAVAGGDTTLQGVVHVSGPVTVESSGQLTIDGSTTLQGAAGVVDAGLIEVTTGAILTMAGTVDVSGVLQLDQTGTSQGSDLQVTAAGLTLEGGGQFDLDNPYIYTDTAMPSPPSDCLIKVFAATGAATLVNVDDTIVGAGNIGDGRNGDLTLVNDSRGVINASLTTDLVVKDVGGGVTNDGLMESTGVGGLYVDSSVVNQTGGGELLAAGGVIYFSYADIQGGTLATSETGEFYFDWGDTVLDGRQGVGLANKGKIYISDEATLTVEGAIDNTGQIGVGTSADQSQIVVGAGGATLTGAGNIMLNGTNPGTGIVGLGGVTLTNVDNTISGHGVIGGPSMSLVNAGSIEANAVDSLTLSGAIANTGLIEATGIGGLMLSSTTIANAGGTITAASKIVLTDADIEGGTLATSGSGLLEVASAATLDGTSAAVNLPGSLVVLSGASLTGAGTLDLSGDLTVDGSATLQGPIRNNGELKTLGGSLAAQGAVTGTGDLVIDGGTASFASSFAQGVTFDGGGELVLAYSQGYSGAISGFSTKGTDTLDLEDIAFGGATTASYSGTAAGGVLTVTDGTHTTRIALKGDYLSSTFTVAADGEGGTLVTDPTASAPALASAMAAFAPASAAAGPTQDTARPGLQVVTMLTQPSNG